ncbi:hypothetical protein F5Y18DRAFT_441500, partial [Xylariaceae sp. FL1019]
MCWQRTYVHHCFTCNTRFAVKQAKAPCYASECGYTCTSKPAPAEIEVTEDCDECKQAQKAEETCQRTVYHMQPLNLTTVEQPRTRKREQCEIGSKLKRLRIKPRLESALSKDRRLRKERKSLTSAKKTKRSSSRLLCSSRCGTNTIRTRPARRTR